MDSVRRHFPDAKRVAVIVCGGVGVTAEQLRTWQRGAQG
jgi:L-serine/L-threonine ammonia-lyase